MSFAEKNRIFLAKLRALPEEKKKMILWTTVSVIGVVLLFFWIRGLANDLPKLSQQVGEKVQSFKLSTGNPPNLSVKIPEALLPTTTPTNK